MSRVRELVDAAISWGTQAWESSGIGQGGGEGGGNSVPELSLTVGPVALAVIVALIAIGLERRRRKHQNET